jgi:hypothetical protein
VRRRWLSLRAITFHLLLLVIVPGCLLAGWWQVHRAMDGNVLSYAYSIEWPIFAVIAVIGWWQLIQEDPADVRARHAERIRRAQLHEAAATEDPAMWAIGLRRDNELSGLSADPVAIAAAAQRALGLGGPDGAGPGQADSDDTGSGPAVAPPSLASDDGADDEVAAATLQVLTAYDLYLQRLAAGSRRKTWRRPQGLPAPTAGSASPTEAGPDDEPAGPVIDVEGVAIEAPGPETRPQPVPERQPAPAGDG